MSNTAILLDN